MPKMLNCIEYVNADEIAKGLSPFKPESVSFEAGRLMLRRIRNLVNDNESFAFETTLASKTFTSVIEDCKSKGYLTTLIYIWLENPDAAIERVKERVQNGGHGIPVDVIKRRYNRSIANLFELYLPIVETCYVVDNSSGKPFEIAHKSINTNMSITDETLWKKLKAKYEQD